MSLLLALQGGGGATITADMAATEAKDVAAFTAQLAHAAALAVTEAQDIAAFSASIAQMITADLDATEVQDVASLDARAEQIAQGGVTPFVSYWRRKRLAHEEEKAAQAVIAAAEAEIQVAEAVDKGHDIAKALQVRRRAEEAYLAAHRAALLEQYLEAAILKRFREEVAALRFEMMRRAALLLLLAA